ncbi:unnamed protein product [Linum tenue]|uniref:Uncharacterized protein n=1 Tax=Linum tenue TaxID=586396 RepID=A0AAV0K0F2_9ROSI|nr:unnamed protein product [Linum tenue]
MWPSPPNPTAEKNKNGSQHQPEEIIHRRRRSSLLPGLQVRRLVVVLDRRHVCLISWCRRQLHMMNSGGQGSVYQTNRTDEHGYFYTWLDGKIIF